MGKPTSRESIAARILHARTDAGYATAVEAAAATKIHVQSVRDQESGRRGADVEHLDVYARVYKVNFEWLATGRGPMRYDDKTLQHWVKRLDPDSLEAVIDFAKFKGKAS
jgi:hypothetical protein